MPLNKYELAGPQSDTYGQIPSPDQSPIPGDNLRKNSLSHSLGHDSLDPGHLNIVGYWRGRRCFRIGTQHTLNFVMTRTQALVFVCLWTWPFIRL